MQERENFANVSNRGSDHISLLGDCRHGVLQTQQEFTRAINTQNHFHDYFQSCVIFRRNSKTKHNSNLTNKVIICNKNVTSVISSAAKSLAWLEVFHLEF